MSEYGKLNGVPINPGEGWEIVPAGEFQTEAMEWTMGGSTWHMNREFLKEVKVGTHTHVRAFRRPIVAKEMLQAGQRETNPASFSLRVDVANKKYTVVQKADGRLTALRYGEEWRDCVGDGLIYSLAAELDEARTLTTAQSKALEKAEGAFKKHAIHLPSCTTFYSWHSRCDCGYDEALTLIQKANEVGK